MNGSLESWLYMYVALLNHCRKEHEGVVICVGGGPGMGHAPCSALEWSIGHQRSRKTAVQVSNTNSHSESVHMYHI